MKRLEKAFDSIKTPDSWKENLYKAAYAETPKIKKKFSIKRVISVSLAAATLCMASALTVGAVTGTFNIVEILRGGFSDEISTEKYINGQYQPLDVSCENDQIAFKAVAFMGDVDETYTLVQATLKEDIPVDEISIDVSVNENNVTNYEDYGSSIVTAVPDTDADGNTVYFFNIRNLPSCGLYEIGSESLIMRINKVIYRTGYKEKVKDVDLSMEFVPETSYLSPVEYHELYEEVEINGTPCTVTYAHLSDYQASITFSYTIPETLEIGGEVITDYFRIADLKIRDILNLKSENAYQPIPEECPVKLIVDGAVMDFSEYNEAALHAPYDNIMGPCEDDEYNSLFYCVVNFKPFKFSEAESVAFEITTTNGDVKTFKLK